MTAISLTISLPDDVAQEAEAAGLLAPGEIARLVQEEMDRQAALKALLADKVAETLADPAPSLPQAEVFADLRRHHAQRLGR